MCDAFESERDEFEASSASMAQSEVEALILAAGDYVVPSDDLRARIVEDATGEDRVRKFAGRAGVATLVVLLVWGCLMPIARTLGNLRNEVTAPMPAEVEEMAFRESAISKPAIDAEQWSLVEVFSRMRTLDLGRPD